MEHRLHLFNRHVVRHTPALDHREPRKGAYEVQALKEHPKVTLPNPLKVWGLIHSFPQVPLQSQSLNTQWILCCCSLFANGVIHLKSFILLYESDSTICMHYVGSFEISWGCEVDQLDSLEWKKLLGKGGDPFDPIGISLESWRKGQIQVL